MPSHHLVLDGYVPPSNNVLIRAHFRKRMKWKHELGWLVKKEILNKAVQPEFDWAYPRVMPNRGKIVRIDVYRRCLVDDDNFIGGLKLLVDVLKEQGLIWDDSPRFMELRAKQFQDKKLRGTDVYIEDPI